MALEMGAAVGAEPANNKTEANVSNKRPQQLVTEVLNPTKEQNMSINEQEANNNNSSEQQQQQLHELELMGRETQELRTRARRLQLEVEEKDEIIGMLRDELEVTKETSDKLGKENLRLVKDSRRVKFLEDENDFLQDRVAAADRLEQETKKLKERLVELDYLRLRVTELEEDRQRAQDECQANELARNEAELRAARVAELEQELAKWKLFSQELEAEKSSMQAKLLESIEQEAQLAKTNTKVEAEVRRLKDLVRAHEEQRDEQEASNSLILSSSVAEDLKSLKVGDDEEEDGEEEQLRKRLEELEQLVSEMRQTNHLATAELEANRRLISELRQDLACEKNLALKLTNQLASFTKQIKSLDKQYFPMHEVPGSQDQQHAKNKQQQQPRDNNTTTKLISIKTTTINSRSCGGGEKESSRGSEIGKGNNSYVTSSGYSSKKLSATKKPKEVLLCVNDQKKTNQANSSSNKGREEADNETATKRQLAASGGVSGSSETTGAGSKLSAKELPKNHSPLDNGNLVGKQSISEQEPRLVENESQQKAEDGRSGKLNISAIADEQQTEQATASSSPPQSPVTNKSANRRSDDESLAKSVSPSPSRVIGASDRLESSTNKNLSKPLSIDAYGAREDELPGLFRAKPGATCANNNGNNNATDQRQHQASVSPSLTVKTTITNSKSPSPSVPATSGHDSGFQSIINHDLNPSPNAEARLASNCNLSAATGAATITKDTTSSNQSKTINGLEESTVVASATSDCKTPTLTKDKVLDSISRYNIDLNSGQLTKGSQEQQQADESAATAPLQQRPAKTCSPGYIPVATTTTAINPKPRYPIDTNGQQSSDIDSAGSAKTKVETDDQTDEAARSASKSANRNFARNSLPSRSVNFGHSRPTPGGYLDRIRASVTATTTTNTTSSFSEQTSNIVLSQQQQHQHPHSQHVPYPAPHLLNCLLDHKHTERCFVKHTPQVGLVASIPNGHYDHMPVQSSRQLNALIDPVSQQRLAMSMLHHSGLPQQPPTSAQQQQHHHHHLHHLYHAHRGGFDELKREERLTEQQIAHLANLNHQHYYHHLHQMHQLHQLHHLHHHHHLQHKYQQQQQQQGSSNNKPSVPTSASREQSSDTSSTAREGHCEPIYTGGSQFYAPSLNRSFEQQVYANTTLASQSASQQQANGHRNRLVKGVQQQQHSDTSRSSPSRHQNARLSPSKSQQQQQLNHYTLPQIDEVNGLPTVDVNHQQQQHHHHNQQQNYNSSEKLKTRNTSTLIMPSVGVKDNGNKQHSVATASATASNDSPPSSSSSPTSTSSSASSNLSPSSASSSSSLNSLSTSSAPLNRSALRHTSTDLNRRQFSIERELISSTPMTATLSRIGSCRASASLSAGVCGKTNGEANSNNFTTKTGQIVCSHRQQQLLQSPAKSQQPPMKNSKILNIGQQSACAQKLAAQEQQQHHQHQQHRLSLDGSVGGRRTEIDKLLANNNLANIRLNDSLAFTSLRAPKNSPGLINLNRSLSGGGADGSGNGKSTTAQQPPARNSKVSSSSSSSPERQRKLNGTGNAGTIIESDIKTGQASGTNGNKSSVWFEYGCV